MYRQKRQNEWQHNAKNRQNTYSAYVDTSLVQILLLSALELNRTMQAFLKTGKIGGGFAAPSTSSGKGAASDVKKSIPWVEK